MRGIRMLTWYTQKPASATSRAAQWSRKTTLTIRHAAPHNTSVNRSGLARIAVQMFSDGRSGSENSSTTVNSSSQNCHGFHFSMGSYHRPDDEERCRKQVAGVIQLLEKNHPAQVQTYDEER